MTSALSSLKKGRRIPLPNSRAERTIPYRSPPPHEQEHSHMPDLQSGENVDTSMLLSSMTKRLLTAEQQVASYAKQVIEKDKTIHELQDKVAALERQAVLTSANTSRSDHLSAVESEFHRYQKQVHEMEQFLNDHGLVWVGEPDSDEDISNIQTQTMTAGQSQWQSLPEQWCPNASVAQHTDSSTNSFINSHVDIDFDRLLTSVKELSILGGEGRVQVQHTLSGAKLEHIKAIPLTLHKNGFFLFQGPFRPYLESSSQQFLRDLLDGYFPSELQSRYPDGVPFEVTDLRDVIFDDPRQARHFPGLGRQLGGEITPSRLVSKLTSDSASQKDDWSSRHTNVPPGGFVREDRFLQRLPKSVIRNGRVINIRGDIASMLQDTDTTPSSSVSLVSTPVVEDMRKRMEADERSRPTTPRHVTTLRVKLEDGQKTLIIKLPFSATIADLRHYIDQQRSPSSQGSYVIRSSFPSKVHTNLRASLQESGLTPNAVLFLSLK